MEIFIQDQYPGFLSGSQNIHNLFQSFAIIVCNLLYSVMAGTVVWLLFTHLTWPEGWIPSRWSDFGFWKEKVDQAVAEFKLYLMLPKTVSQTEGMILGGKTVCAGGGSCFLYLLWKVYEKGYDRISDRGRRGKDFPVEQN